MLMSLQRGLEGSWGGSDQMVIGRLQVSGISVGWECIRGEDGRRDTDEAAGGIMLD